jgi:regulator of sigma E protease
MVEPGKPAALAGFQVGDQIKQAAGRTIRSFADLQQIIMLRADVPVKFVIDRGGREVILTATPVRQQITDPMGSKHSVGVLGFGYIQKASDQTWTRYGPIEALALGAERTWSVLDTTVFYLGRVVTGKESAAQLGGPIGIARASGAVAQAGAEGAPDLGMQILGSLVALMGLAAVLSVGIGFMNLLPVPILDGGHLLFYAYEAIARHPLNAEIQAMGYRIGMALLLSLMVFATWNDLQQLQLFQFLGGLFS